MLKVQEENFRDYHRRLAGCKGRLNLGFLLVTVFIMWYSGSAFENVVVGVLPFEPIGMFSSMTHRGLNSSNMREVGAFFILSMITSGFRGVIGKIVGKEPPRMPVEHQTPKWMQTYMKD